MPKLWELVFSDPPAPLYRFVLYGWAGLFGENEIVARIPSFICGVAAIFLTYAIAKKYGGIQAAFLAALFLCFSPTHVWYSQEATSYAMTLCFLLATVLVWKELKSGTRPRTLVFLLWSFPNLRDFHALSRCRLLIASHHFDTRRITSGVEKNYRDKFSRGRAGSQHARYKIPSWEDHWCRPILSPSLHVGRMVGALFLLVSAWECALYFTALGDPTRFNQVGLIGQLSDLFSCYPCPRTSAATRQNLGQVITGVAALSHRTSLNYVLTDARWLSKDICRTVSSHRTAFLCDRVSARRNSIFP